MQDDEPTARRIANLEASVRAMRAEIEALRREIRAPRADAPAPAVSDAAFPSALPSSLGRVPSVADPRTPRAGPVGHGLDEELREQAESREPRARIPRGPDRRRPSVDLEASEIESLVGRYGTLALGALTILMAVGAFLGWAITNDLIRITPAMRVGLGFAAAGLIAALGWRMRTHASPRFGNTLLALALAVVHVDAWGAGPYLGLVSHLVALAIAAAASAALAALALRTGEESLFAVGFGGALVAPFVTSSGRGDLVALLGYGLVVIALGLLVLRTREWTVARRLAVLAAWTYAFAAVGLDRRSATNLVHLAPTSFTILCALVALAVVGEPRRLGLARSFLALGVLVLAATNEWYVPDAAWAGLAFAGLLTSYASARLSSAGPRPSAAESGEVTAEGGAMEAIVLPLGFLLAALFKLDATTERAWLAGAFSAAALVMTLADRRRFAQHLTTALLASAVAAVVALHERDVVCLVVLAAHGALSAVLVRRTGRRLLVLPAVAVLAPAALWALGELRARPDYAYTPFLGPASLAALAVSAAWLVFSWQVSGGARTTAARWSGLAAAFFWVREELARAGSPDQATFLLVSYYALAGVVAISAGRLRNSSDLRRLGLVLSILAAGKALVQASGLASIGLKVGSYVVVGCFLLAVAYWYRAAGDSPRDDAAPA